MEYFLPATAPSAAAAGIGRVVGLVTGRTIRWPCCVRPALQVATPTEPGIHGELLGPGGQRGGGGEGRRARTWTPGEARLDAIIIELHVHEEDGMRLASYKTIHALLFRVTTDDCFPSPRPKIRNFQYILSAFRHRRMPFVPEAHLVLFFFSAGPREITPRILPPQPHDRERPKRARAIPCSAHSQQGGIDDFPSHQAPGTTTTTTTRSTPTLPGQGTALGRTGRSQGAVSPRFLAKPLPWSSPKGSPLARPSSSIRSTPLSPLPSS